MIHSFLLIGQSNMAGRGRMDDVIEINKERLKVLRMGRWQNLFRPVNPDRRTSGVCLAESFAEAYARDHQDVEVGLIPCADGGTRIDQWMPGSLLFDHAVYQARLAQRTSTIAGILWHQGESDSRNDRHLVYTQKLTEMLLALRKELNLWDVPVIMGGIGSFIDNYARLPHHQWREINQCLQQVADSDPKYAFVPADGLAHRGDDLHFSSPALHELGLRYYDAFRALEDPNKIFEEKPDPDNALRTELESL